MVIFCTKTRGGFTLREPVEADYLHSQARKEHLLPQHEMDIQQFDDRADEVITKDSMYNLRASQRQSALNHWHVMRMVIPNKVWENW